MVLIFSCPYLTDTKRKFSYYFRFTSFILGGSHITDDELLLYNTDPGHMPYHGEDDSNDQSDIDLQWDEESSQ